MTNRDGCPECEGPVVAVLITCDLGEEHVRYECTDCGEDAIRESELVTVTESDLLDAAAELQAGRVLPALVPWVKARSHDERH